MTTIVVSAVNIRKGGTLTILNDCLRYLSQLASRGDVRVVAIVHRCELCFFTGIEYIEIPSSVNNWAFRLWNEYFRFHKISKKIGHIHFWLSLHDTTPRVKADCQAVYCQTAFPFYRWKWRDVLMDYKIPLFAMLTRYAYRINVRKNRYLIVQQEWLRKSLGQLLRISEGKFVVFPPATKPISLFSDTKAEDSPTTFLYAATADCHKNFEVLCEATKLLERQLGEGKFQTLITIDGTENRYAAYLKRRWGDVPSLKFAGFQPQQRLLDLYAKVDCLVFPSEVETWGLPISEFAYTKKPMLLADLPYAHETAAGSNLVAFFDTNDANELKCRMYDVYCKNLQRFSNIKQRSVKMPAVCSWSELFQLLLLNS